MLVKAITFAAKAHDGQFRKGTATPYITHPLETLTIVSGLSNDLEVLCAAVLHDTLEDTDTNRYQLKEAFGDRVVKLVEGVTEDKLAGIPKSETWKRRKQATIDYLRDGASYEEKLIVFADKISNLRSLKHDSLRLGHSVWLRFNCQDPLEHKWYYSEILKQCSELKNTAEYSEYEELLSKIWK